MYKNVKLGAERRNVRWISYKKNYFLYKCADYIRIIIKNNPKSRLELDYDKPSGK